MTTCFAKSYNTSNGSERLVAGTADEAQKAFRDFIEDGTDDERVELWIGHPDYEESERVNLAHGMSRKSRPRPDFDPKLDYPERY